MPGRQPPLTIALIAALAIVVAACSSGDASDDTLATYERIWPDGFTEVTTVYEDGRVRMLHGETLERLTITHDELERLRGALEQPIATGSPDDSPVRTLTLPDGTVLSPPRFEPGGAVDLLDRLTTTHSLETTAPPFDPDAPTPAPITTTTPAP